VIAFNEPTGMTTEIDTGPMGTAPHDLPGQHLDRGRGDTHQLHPTYGGDAATDHPPYDIWWDIDQIFVSVK
jgi:hypothetical protein